MNMRARFGMGLFAGLLLGFLIVGSTALYSPGQVATPAALMASHEPAYQASPSLTTASSTSTITFAATTTTGFAGGGALNSSVGSPQSAIGAIEYYGVTNTQGNGSGERAVLASEVDSIPRQPLVISLAVFLPVVAAVLFGAVFYRVSMSRQEEGASSAP